MEYQGQTTRVRMYDWPLSADDIFHLYHNKTILIDWDKVGLAKQAGEIYLMVNANLYNANSKLNALSVELLRLLSAVNRKLFDRIWLPKSQENKK